MSKQDEGGRQRLCEFGLYEPLAEIVPIGGASAEPLPEYERRRKQAASALEASSGKLFSAALNLATAGAWKAWSDAQPPGTRFRFSLEDLAGVDDPAVRQLVAAIAMMESVREEIDDGGT